MEQKPNNQPNPQDPKQDRPPKNNVWIPLVVSIAIILIGSWIFNAVSNGNYTEKNYSDFLSAMESDQIAEVELQADRILYLTKEEAAKKPAEQKACFTGLPAGGDTMELAEKLTAQGVKVNKKIVNDNSTILMILYYVFMGVLFFVLFRTLMKRMSGDGMMGGMGKSRAKLYMERQTGVTFNDVAGQDEAKESLQEIIDFLHEPQKYTEIGAKLPKGASLEAPS